jgi:2-oxoglutarate ferredoxin oxidoreductase subunit delta
MTKTEGTDATHPQERKPRRARPKAKGRVIIYSKWCKECGICIAFCPREVLAWADDGSVLVANPQECTACRWCELHCPDFAITVRRIDE